MKISRVLIGVGILLLGCGAWYWQSLTEIEPSKHQSDLSQTINQCDLIAGKAAAELPEVLPFQKLEKAARQSRVLERCMQDRGYQENPAWVIEANKKAERNAHEQSISQAEAYETLRRHDMLQADEKSPAYWRKHP